MPIEGRWRAVAPSTTDAADAWSLIGYHAHHRMSEVLHEAEQTRLAGLTRRSDRSAFVDRHRLWIPALVSGALAAVTNVVRHLAIASHGSDAR